jgi:hypothetical protein
MGFGISANIWQSLEQVQGFFGLLGGILSSDYTFR